LEENE
jgi:hypothetical protein